jgi:HEAT repeat protein
MLLRVSPDGSFNKLSRAIQSCGCYLAVVISALAISGIAASGEQHTASGGQAETNETMAQELLNDKRYSFEDLLHAKPEAVANAKRIFALTSDPQLKQRLASILLSVGARDGTYRDYLAHAAREALADETPWPTQFNEKGEASWNPIFLQWCKKQELSPITIRKRSYYEMPVPWYFLASSGDPAFYELLIEGLHSHNLMIAGLAAKGLARLQDVRAVDSLIDAGKHTSVEARFAIGQSLLYFSCHKAQTAAEEFINDSDKNLFELARRKAREEGVKGLFQW